MREMLKKSVRATVVSIACFIPMQWGFAGNSVTLTMEQTLQEQRAWAKLTTKTATVEGIRWTYSEGGDVNKPTILLLHGLAGSRDNWNMIANKLTNHYHVIIPDLPAHGDTEVPADYSYDINDVTTSLRRLMEQLGFEKKLHVAGHSLGGAIAGLYSGLYFMDAQSLMVVDSAGIFKTVENEFMKNPDKMRELVVKQKGDINRLFSLAMNQPPFIPQGLIGLQEQMMISGQNKLVKFVDKLIETSKNNTPEGFAISVKAIEAPTLVIWGEKDRIFPVQVVPELTELLKNEEPAIIIPNVGHMPILEADQIVAEHYLKFLRGAGAKPSVFQK